MKKRFISLVAAAALVGSVAAVSTPVTAQAGTVAVKGNTAVQMYGFIKYEAGWTNKMVEDTIYGNLPDKNNTKTKFSSNAEITRLGFTFNNADANVGGRIESDFWGGKLRLRRAYIKHQFDNFYVLAGQEWGIEEVNTFSAAWISPAGFNGHSRMPQLQVGTNLDLGGATLDLALAFEDKTYAEDVVRRTMPGIAAKAKVKFDTGFGTPASVYAFGVLTPVKITSPIDEKEKGETPTVFGVGFALPVSMVTLQSEYIYTKGAVGFSGLSGKVGGLLDLSKIPSYWPVNGSVKAVKSDAWNIEAKVAPMPCTSIAAGYDYVKFKIDDIKPKITTVFANIAYKTTKYTKLTFEWDHVKVKADNLGIDSQTGNQYWFDYTYNF